MLPDIKSELEDIKLVKGNIDLSGKRTPIWNQTNETFPPQMMMTILPRFMFKDGKCS